MTLTLFTEILPINISQLPTLYFYEIKPVGNIDFEALCRPLQYRIKQKFGGYWVWSKADHLMISDILLTTQQINSFIQELWQDQSNNIFQQQLENILHQEIYTPTSQGISDFVAQGLLSRYNSKISTQLEQSKKDKGQYYIKLIHYFGSWVVDGKPSISLSLKQEIEFKGTLKSYMESNPNFNIVGIHVLDNTKPFNTAQEIIEPIGLLGEGNRRQRLLSQTQSKKMKELIEKAPDDELVVKIGNKNKAYDYIVSTLRIRVLNQDYLKFSISESLQIVSEERIKYLQPIFNIIQSEQFLDKVYTSQRNEKLFVVPDKKWGYNPSLLFRDASIEADSIPNLIAITQQHGEFKSSNKSTIQISILNGINKDYIKRSLEIFKTNIKAIFDLANPRNKIKYTLQLVEQQDIDILKTSRSALEKTIQNLAQKSPDIVLCLLPNSLPKQDAEDRTVYDDLKQLCLKYNLQSQMIREKTLTEKFSTRNIVLGILAKNGSIPYILANKLEYTDFVVGLDVSRRQKKNLKGTNSVAAMTRIYSNQGELIHYSIRDAAIDGEIIPERILYDLFPSDEYQNKRVVIHRDGNFPEEERKILKKIANEINAQFYFVSVIKSGNPRLYGRLTNQQGEKIFSKAPKGSVFLLSDTEALLISSDFPDRFQATPRALKIQSFDNFPLQNAVHSVLSLTYLHYGSERPPRLPVTTYYADAISTMASKGIKPRDLDGNIPFWL